MDNLDYFPDGAWPAEDFAYQGYPAADGARPVGRHRSTVQSGPVQSGPVQAVTVWQQLAESQWAPPGAPPARQPYVPMVPPDYPEDDWADILPGGQPWPPQEGWVDDPSATTWPREYPQAGYGPGYDGYDAAQLQQPRDGRLYDPYRGSGPMQAPPRGSGPMRQMPPDRGSGPMRSLPPDARQRTASSLLAGFASAPAGYAPPPGPARQSPRTGPMRHAPGAGDWAPPPPVSPVRPRRPAPHGKTLPEWLPFGSRLVLLPKEEAGDGDVREHRDISGGWLRPAVFGAMDGVVTNASLIAGIGGGGGGHGTIVLTGMAGLIAGAFSMATGEYISVKSQNELTQAEVDVERRQHARDRVGKLHRLTELLMDKGVSPNLAEAVARQISADPDRAVETHLREELGIDPDDLPSPRTAAGVSFLSFTVGALVPLGPFLVGVPSLPASLVLSGLFAFGGGAAVARLTGRPAVLGGMRQFVAAALATGMAFLVGHLVGGVVG